MRMPEPDTTDVIVFAVDHVDIGFTIETRITINGYPVVSYMPGTRHMSTAKVLALEILTDALAPLIAAAAKAHDCQITSFEAGSGA